VAAPDDTLDDVPPAVDDGAQADADVVVAADPSVDGVGEPEDGPGVAGSPAAPVVTGPQLTGPPPTAAEPAGGR
jgi:hypothetical protein